MKGPDVLLLVVGILIFGSAGTGLVLTRPTAVTSQGSAIGLFDVAYGFKDEVVGRQNVPNYQAGSAEFRVSTHNVTQVKVDVQCTDPASAAPFTLQVTVEGPNQTRRGPVTGMCGQPLVVTVPVAPRPSTNRTQGDDESEARANLANEGEANAVGTWKVTVTGSRQGLPLPAGNPGGDIVLSVQTWQARLTPAAR